MTNLRQQEQPQFWIKTTEQHLVRIMSQSSLYFFFHFSVIWSVNKHLLYSKHSLTLCGYKDLVYCSVQFSSVQFISVAQSCPTLCDPMNRSTPGLPVHHQLPEFTQTRIHWVRDAIQLSHPQSSPSPPALNPSQHQSLFQWVNYLHEMAKILEFQL